MTKIAIILTTCPSTEVAEKIGRTLVEERLAACVNIIPGVRSIYTWEGKTCDEGEILLLVKTAADRVAETEERIRSLHPYDLPEVVSLSPSGGSEEYAQWVTEGTRP